MKAAPGLAIAIAAGFSLDARAQTPCSDSRIAFYVTAAHNGAPVPWEALPGFSFSLDQAITASSSPGRVQVNLRVNGGIDGPGTFRDVAASGIYVFAILNAGERVEINWSIESQNSATWVRSEAPFPECPDTAVATASASPGAFANRLNRSDSQSGSALGHDIIGPNGHPHWYRFPDGRTYRRVDSDVDSGWWLDDQTWAYWSIGGDDCRNYPKTGSAAASSRMVINADPVNCDGSELRLSPIKQVDPAWIDEPYAGCAIDDLIVHYDERVANSPNPPFPAIERLEETRGCYTIGMRGCELTALAICLEYYGVFRTPAELNAMLCAGGYYTEIRRFKGWGNDQERGCKFPRFDGAEVATGDWEAFIREWFGLDLRIGISSDCDLSLRRVLREALDAGSVPMLRVHNDQHWVVVSGYRCNGTSVEYNTIDPGSTSGGLNGWQTFDRLNPSKARILSRTNGTVEPRRAWIHESGRARVTVERFGITGLEFSSATGLTHLSESIRASHDLPGELCNPYLVSEPLPPLDPDDRSSDVHVTQIPPGRYIVRGTALADGPLDIAATWTGAGGQTQRRAESANLQQGQSISFEMLVGACDADFDTDGFVDFFDFSAFIDCFEGIACPNGRSSDFNGDGFADFFDFQEFVDAFERGC